MNEKDTSGNITFTPPQIQSRSLLSKPAETFDVSIVHLSIITLLSLTLSQYDFHIFSF